MIVLDASAMLAFLFQERGTEHVAPVLESAAMSTVNLCEVLGRFARDGFAVEPVRHRLLATAIEWVAFDCEHAARCAGLIPKTTSIGLSLGDRACLSLGLVKRAPVLTADRAWLGLDVGVEVRCIR